MVGGDTLTDAQATFQNNEPVVSFKFDSVGGKILAGSVQCLAYRGRISYVGDAGRDAVPFDAGTLRAVNDVITRAQPSNSISMPTKTPITQTADSGHSCQIRAPSTRVMTPLSKAHVQPQKRSLTATIMRNSPPTKNVAASTRVKTAAAAIGLWIISNPTTI